MGIEQHYRTPFVIYRKNAGDGSWGSSGVFAAVGIGNGMLQPSSGKIMQVNEQRTGVSTHLLYCSPYLDIRQLDELVINGKRYTVLMAADAAGIGHHLEIDLELSA